MNHQMTVEKYYSNTDLLRCSCGYEDTISSWEDANKMMLKHLKDVTKEKRD